jgi:hypothetical protein
MTMLLPAIPAFAQTQGVNAKPAMYSFVAKWQFRRAAWPDAEKAAKMLNQVMQKALADGTIVAYGDDVNVVHQPDAETHHYQWSSMSMAGLLMVLNQLHASSGDATPALNDAKERDEVYVSHFYNWKSGSTAGGYKHVAIYKLNADASDNAITDLSQYLFAPVLEKMLANGTIVGYEIDTMAVHTAAPGTFAIAFVSPTPEGLDAEEAELHEAVKAAPLSGEALSLDVDHSDHRDELYKTNCTYK